MFLSIWEEQKVGDSTEYYASSSNDPCLIVQFVKFFLWGCVKDNENPKNPKNGEKLRINFLKHWRLIRVFTEKYFWSLKDLTCIFFVFDLGGVRNPALPSDLDALLISKRDWLNQKVGQIKAYIASQ